MMPIDSVLEIESIELTQKPSSYPAAAKQLYATLELPPDSRCIRVLDIDRPSAAISTVPGAGVINGHLRVVNLDQQPSFTALSYVWGERASPSPVVRLAPHGCNVEITENCYQALWHIQQRFGAVTIWVDSISIDQKDEHEKEGQIPLMREIYSSAKIVYIWLGQGTESSDKSMEYLKNRASYGRRLPISILASSCPKERNRQYWAFKMRTFGDIITRLGWIKKKRNGIKLQELLDREWIHRSWTLQEFILATNIVLLCGTKALSWEDAVSALCNGPEPPEAAEDPNFLPVPKAVLNQWRCLIDLWLNMPRSQRGNSKQNGTNLSDQPTFRNDLIERCKLASLPKEVVLLYAFITLVFQLSFWGAWGLASYEMVMSGKKRKIIGILWLFIALGWLYATVLVFYCLVKVQKKLHFLSLGWKQAWLFKTSTRSIEHNVLDVIQTALASRTSSDPRDKSYSLNGILKACGMSPTNPDYTCTIRETYRNLVTDLLSWSPDSMGIIMDAGGGNQLIESTWVPNWQRTPPSHWLTSQHHYGSLPSCAPLKSARTFRVEGSRLFVPGISKGRISFFEKLPRNAQRTDADWLKKALDLILRWVIYIQEHRVTNSTGVLRDSLGSSYRGPNDEPVSFLFAVLEGHSPKRGPTERFIQGHSGGPDGDYAPDRWERLPPVQGPYDFRTRASHFEHWQSLHKIIQKYVDTLNKRSDRDDTAILLDELILEIKGDLKAQTYCQRLLTSLWNDRRSLFALETGYVGTGPGEIELGDEVFLLAGVPVPMVLRQAPGGDLKRVVGAVLVHGLMHGEHFERFDKGNFKEIALM